MYLSCNSPRCLIEALFTRFAPLCPERLTAPLDKEIVILSKREPPKKLINSILLNYVNPIVNHP